MDLLQLADSDLGDVGHKVVGDAVGVLADQAGRMGADGVEVAQQRNIQLGVSLAAVGQDALGASASSLICHTPTFTMKAVR